ncbi:histone H3.v1-like [Anneissia japonica]|uniref:histone H3.v1-like n=1 Tax=Anneissia japonica TaxID=1529436 RepID=UPI001425A3DF|nr:histone H3.v1-like [Anneissia japonica]
MGKIRDFQIVIDKRRPTGDEHVFQPGDILCGVVVVHLNEPSKIAKLEIDICGKSSVNVENEHDIECDVEDEQENEEKDMTKATETKKQKQNKPKVEKKVMEDNEEEEECEDSEEEEEEEYDPDEWHFRDSQVLWGGRRGPTKKMPIGRNEIRFEFKIPNG